MKAMILAAGLGERLRPHTKDRAKPSLPFLNVPLMAYGLYWLEQMGLSSLVVNTHHAPETIHQVLPALTRGPYSVEVLHESGQLLGSGGGIRNAMKYLVGEGDFLTCNGDLILLPGHNECFTRFRNMHKEENALASLYVCSLPGIGTTIPAVWARGDGQVLGFGKQSPSADTRPFHFTGIMLLSEKVFKYLAPGPSNILYDALMRAISDKQKVLAVVDPGARWFETGSPEAYLQATRECLDLINIDSFPGETLRQILKRFSPGWDNYKVGGTYSFERIPLKPEQLPVTGIIGRNNRIHSSAVLKGFVCLGDEAQVGANCVIEDSVFGHRCQIAADQHPCGVLKL